MLTLESIIGKKLPVSHILTDQEKTALIEENRGKDYSLESLMKEMFNYKVTVNDLLMGWGGVAIFKIGK